MIIFALNMLVLMCASIFLEQDNLERQAKYVDFSVKLAGDMAIDMAQATDDFFTSEDPYGYGNGTSYTEVVIPGGDVTSWIPFTHRALDNTTFNIKHNSNTVFNKNEIGQFQGSSAFNSGVLDIDTPVNDKSWGLNIPLAVGQVQKHVVKDGEWVRFTVPSNASIFDAIDPVVRKPAKGDTYVAEIVVGELIGTSTLGYVDGTRFTAIGDLVGGKTNVFEFKPIGDEFKLALRSKVEVIGEDAIIGTVQFKNVVVTRRSVPVWVSTGEVKYNDVDFDKEGEVEYVSVADGAKNTLKLAEKFKVERIGNATYASITAKIKGSANVILREYDKKGEEVFSYSDTLESSGVWKTLESKPFLLHDETESITLEASGSSGAFAIDNFYASVNTTLIPNWEMGYAEKDESIFTQDENGKLNLMGKGSPSVKQYMGNLESGKKYRVSLEYASNVPIDVTVFGKKHSLGVSPTQKQTLIVEHDFTGGDTALLIQLLGDADNSYCALSKITIEYKFSSSEDTVILVPNPGQAGNVTNYWSEANRRDRKPSEFNATTDINGFAYTKVNMFDYYFGGTSNTSNFDRDRLYQKMYTNNNEFQSWVNTTGIMQTKLYGYNGWESAPSLLHMGANDTIKGNLSSRVSAETAEAYKMQTAVKEGYFGAYYYTPLSLGGTYLDTALVEFLFNNNMDIIMRSKYVRDPVNGIEKGLGAPRNNLFTDVYADMNLLDDKAIINNGYFGFKRGDLTTKDGRKYFNGGAECKIDYKIVDAFNSANDELLKLAFGVNRMIGSTVYDSKADYLKAISTVLDPETGLKPTSLFVSVAKVTYTADIIVPYAMPFTREWKGKISGDTTELLEMERDFTNLGGEMGDYGSTLYNYTTYFAVMP